VSAPAAHNRGSSCYEGGPIARLSGPMSLARSPNTRECPAFRPPIRNVTTRVRYSLVERPLESIDLTSIPTRGRES
jgi:hypothetical protein